MNQVRLHLRRRKEDIVRTRSGRRKANMEIGRKKFQMWTKKDTETEVIKTYLRAIEKVEIPGMKSLYWE